MTITAAGTPSPDTGTAPVPAVPVSMFDPVHPSGCPAIAEGLDGFWES
jgi:hypothetical protein